MPQYVLRSLVAVIFACLTPALQAAPSRPNIVVIMADDLEMGSFNTLLANNLMPNLTRYVINKGTTFTNSFVSTALCCPSRSTFLTGLYSHNHGVVSNEQFEGGVLNFDDTSTLVTWLHAAGYRTGHIGKYLNFYGTNNDGDDPKDNPTYIPPGYDDWQALLDPTTYRMYNYVMNDNRRSIKFGSSATDYQTDVLAARAKDFIDKAEHNPQPFFLIVTPTAPHLELGSYYTCRGGRWLESIQPARRHIGTLPSYIEMPLPPSFNEANIKDKPFPINQEPPMSGLEIVCANQIYKDRLLSMRAVDDMIGDIVTQLWKIGELDRTVIIFTSDNGFFNGEHRLGRKTWFYDEAVRVPLVLRVPGYPIQQSSKFVLNNDLAPTIAALAGVVPPDVVDGRSLLPLLQNPNANPWRKRILIEFRGTTTKDEVPPFVAVRTSVDEANFPNILYAELDAGEQQLYFMTTDPYQLDSRHADSSTAVLRSIISRSLETLKTCYGVTCQRAEDE